MRKAKFALWICLFRSFIILSLSLVNLGIASIFITPITTFMSVVHIWTHLIIIFIREKRTKVIPANHRRSQVEHPPRLDTLSPTSTLPSMIFTGVLAMLFTAAFILCVRTLTGPPVDSELLQFALVVAVFEAIFEALCACAMVWLIVLGVRERRLVARNMEMVPRQKDNGVRFQDLPPNYTRY